MLADIVVNQLYPPGSIVIPPGQPPTIPGVPIHPIWGPPGFNPIGPGMPPGIWGGPIMPSPPVDPGYSPPWAQVPDNPPEPPGEGEKDKWRWAYSLAYGWVLVPPGGGGKPQPIPPEEGSSK